MHACCEREAGREFWSLIIFLYSICFLFSFFLFAWYLGLNVSLSLILFVS